MKITNKITALLAALGLLAACNDDEIAAPSYTVGEAINAITLRAGISEGGEGATTRASGAEDHHTTPGHVNFTNGTQLRLRVDGTWTGKGFQDNKVSKNTTATTGDQTGANNKHNKVIFSTTSNPVEQLYWDDYGTADPNNSTGRTTGLTIYGVAVEGETTAPTVSDWTSLEWTLAADQRNGWAAKDLLTSNNIQAVDNEKPYATDGTYKFDDYVYDLKNDPDRSSNLIEFTHAMTKMTVVLTAGEGFVSNKFESAPTVTLKQFKNTGNVNIITKTTSPSESKADIQMHLAEGGASNGTATFDALVCPGNKFENATDILELTADGNTYSVTATELNKAIQNAITNTATTGYPGTNNTLLQGWNYKLQITVDKTKILVVATIVDWSDVVADPETPKIDITTAYGIEADGTTEKSFTEAFDFFRSTTIDNGYSNDATVTYNAGTSKYDFSTPLYWPNHSIHYFFRGVYPKVGDAPLTLSGKFSASTSNASAISVDNAKYETSKYPSDLAIGFPRTTEDKCEAHEEVVATDGICATEGEIRMNFRYVMSQVEVELQTVDSPDAAKVNINENTVVELVNVYNSGEVKLSDGSVSVSGDKGSYNLNNVAGENLKRHSAIVPQDLTFTTARAESNLRFKITVTNDDAVLYANATEYNTAKGTSIDDAAFAALTKEQKTKTPATTDVYYADVNPILKSGSTTDKVAPNGRWESGVHYKYVLNLSKTEVNVTATLKNWETTTASDVIWF